MKLKFKREIMEKIKHFCNSKNNDILIWGYGVSGKSFLKFCQSYLDKTNRYIVLDKNFIGTKVDNNITFAHDSFFDVYSDYAQFILPSPGIILNQSAPYYKKVIIEFDIFFYLNQKMNYKTILVTGSIGKTSVVTMLSFYFKKYYESVVNAGNIGIPLLSCVDFTNKQKMVVIEASSAQLEHTSIVSPDYFIITNLYNNHLDFHNNFYDYGMAKLKPLFGRNVIKKCIIHKTVMDFISIYNVFISESDKHKIISFQDQTVYYDPFQICDNHISSISDFPQFSYPENWVIISILSKVIFGVAINYIDEEIPLLPHFRLEKIYDGQGIIIYNDSKSTVMESTESAVKILLKKHEDSLLYCIIGGLSKGVDRKEKFNRLLTLVDKMFVFGKEKNNFFGSNVICKNFLVEVIEEIYNNIKQNNDFGNESVKKQIIVLFSPGGSSFDLYTSYIDRGNSFNQLINLYFDQFYNDCKIDLIKKVDHAKQLE